MNDPERFGSEPETRARRMNPLLDAAYEKAEDVVAEYVAPLVAYFNRLEEEVDHMPIAERFSREHGPNFDFSTSEGIPHPSLMDLNEADYKRAQLKSGVEKARSRAMVVAGLIKSLVLDIEATKQDEIIFVPGKVIRETENFRVVMGWKPGLEEEAEGRRFFIEPKTDEAEKILTLAVKAHRIANINAREVANGEDITARQCLRADYSEYNLLPLLLGKVIVPKEGKDSVPSPDRMEECLKLHPNEYTFSD